MLGLFAIQGLKLWIGRFIFFSLIKLSIQHTTEVINHECLVFQFTCSHITGLILDRDITFVVALIRFINIHVITNLCLEFINTYTSLLILSFFECTHWDQFYNMFFPHLGNEFVALINNTQKNYSNLSDLMFKLSLLIFCIYIQTEPAVPY